MLHEIQLQSTRCAICLTDDHARELYPQRLTPEAFRPATFSARRLPDRLHHRMVRCLGCGLVRSDPVAPADLLTELYGQSSFDYAGEVAGLRATYRRYLDILDEYGVGKGRLLEVGCGSGFFLEEALRAGYASVSGVEPSWAAVAQADPRIRPKIICDVMRPGLFGEAELDVVCLFQVLDHLPDPGGILDECSRVLKPGGLILCLNHNVEALSARILGDRSPIIDVEHTYLFSPRTMARLFGGHGFRVRRVGPVFNTYSLRYLVRLTPLPTVTKRAALAFLSTRPWSRMRLSVPLGNLYLIAEKPQ